MIKQRIKNRIKDSKILKPIENLTDKNYTKKVTVYLNNKLEEVSIN
jgi:hypothetical protein